MLEGHTPSAVKPLGGQQNGSSDQKKGRITAVYFSVLAGTSCLERPGGGVAQSSSQIQSTASGEHLTGRGGQKPSL